MIVLVDYDNLPQVLRNRGLDEIVNRVLHSIGATQLSSYQRVRIRLYGGWFEGKNLTMTAQRLTASMALYPKKFTVSEEGVGGLKTASVNVTVELARSLEIDPRTVIENTYRQGGEVEGVQCMPPPYARCVNKDNCPLIIVHDFLDAKHCPEDRCGLRPTDLLRKAGQKLVDTMMTADIMHFASNGSADLCVTSSDDDLWPGIKSALLLGRKVIHLLTEDKASAARYSRNAGVNYTERMLR